MFFCILNKGIDEIGCILPEIKGAVPREFSQARFLQEWFSIGHSFLPRPDVGGGGVNKHSPPTPPLHVCCHRARSFSKTVTNERAYWVGDGICTHRNSMYNERAHEPVMLDSFGPSKPVLKLRPRENATNSAPVCSSSVPTAIFMKLWIYTE